MLRTTMEQYYMAYNTIKCMYQCERRKSTQVVVKQVICNVLLIVFIDLIPIYINRIKIFIKAFLLLVLSRSCFSEFRGRGHAFCSCCLCAVRHHTCTCIYCTNKYHFYSISKRCYNKSDGDISI